jgi:hypothetical protein
MKILTSEKSDIPAQPLFVKEVPAAGQPMNQITVHHINPKNPTHVRSFQITNQYLLVKRAGQPTVGIDIDAAVHLLSHAVPESSWPPYFTKQPVPITTINDGEVAVLSVETVNEHDHITTSYQWQQHHNPTNQWLDCAGFNGPTFSVKAEGNYHCKAVNAAGESISHMAKIIVKPVPVKN